MYIFVVFLSVVCLFGFHVLTTLVVNKHIYWVTKGIRPVKNLAPAPSPVSYSSFFLWGRTRPNME